MKNIKLIFCFFIFIFCWSCTKEESSEKDGFVTTVDSVVMDAEIGSVQLADDNFLVVCQGQIIKFNSIGKIQWKKNLMPSNVILRNLISLPGTGFAALGINPGNAYDTPVMSVFVYDNDGNFISMNGFHLDTPYYNGITDFIKLYNGNYAFATSTNFTHCGYLKILDQDFNLIYSKAYWSPTNHEITILRLGETPDGGVAIAASFGAGDFDNPVINTAIIVTGPTGNTNSFTSLMDSLDNELPTGIASYNNGLFAITSKMIGWETGNGAFVTYYGRTLIAGRIGIDRFSPDGQFTGRTEFNDYPGFGLINSTRKTADGGFILCGTVNNLGTSFAVSNTKIYLCKIDANLNKQWSKVIPTTYQSIGASAIQTSDGGYQVTGNMKAFDLYDKMILIKTDANGNY